MSTRHISEPKTFQLATTQAAINTLCCADGPRRFLIADEVGLGKTVVAREIIREMIKHRRKPLVVFYISSNLNIAHQNRAKLLELLATEEEQDQAAALADRLTLAAAPANRPGHDRLHLYTLTPDTSVPLYRRRGGFGRMEERALIFRLLKGRFPSLDTRWFSGRCRGVHASPASWNWALNRYAHLAGIRALQDAFLDALVRDSALHLPVVDAVSIASAAESEKPSKFMGSMRTALAVATLREVRPDLVIFDEFQKFRALLIDKEKKPVDSVTSALRGTLSAHHPALLLLSATPYRLYSSRQDEAAGVSHYREFFELIAFLFGARSSAASEVEQWLREYGTMMLSPAKPDLSVLGALREKIEKRLRPVLSRTERPIEAYIQANQSAHIPSELLADDLRVFKHWVARLQEAIPRQGTAVDLMSFCVPYWQSIPMPIQMMGNGYAAWRLAAKDHRRRDEPVLRRSQRDRLNAPEVWPHPQLRALTKIASPPRLALPWVAPSLPWWPLHGPWANQQAAGGKLLIFSRFKAVPPALASVLSFDLEAFFAHRLRHNYRRAGEGQPLQFRGDRPTLPALFFPAPTLIAFTDPRRDNPASLTDVRHSMRRQIGQLFRDRLGVRIKKSGGQRPLWKLLPALEHQRAEAMPACRLPTWADLHSHWRAAGAGQDESMRSVLAQWRKHAYAGLDTVTQSEIAALAEFALSGPGVAVGRALFRFDSACIANERFCDLLDLSWNGLRSYFNRSLFQAALGRRGQPYTAAIPQAVVGGNLESVLDEHLWISNCLNANAIANFCRDVGKALGLREGRHRVHEPGDGGEGFLLRCHAAMPFADARVENTATGREDRLRTDDLRKSFNTPFWPHVLATTSIGQEGLDFHVWCRQLLHWDLSPTPLELEQREGRIQRFGGLSVRRSLASLLGQHSLSEPGVGASPWTVLARHSENEFGGDASGLCPWWSCKGESIDRLFAVMHNSRQTNRFDQLSRQRWLYRLALGQPHQQDFIETVAKLPNDGRHEFVLRLSAVRG